MAAFRQRVALKQVRFNRTETRSVLVRTAVADALLASPTMTGRAVRHAIREYVDRQINRKRCGPEHAPRCLKCGAETT